MNSNKSRKFLVTVNNPWQLPNEELVLQGRDESRRQLTEEYLRCIFEKDTSVVKITGQLELAPTTGTEHMQMFVQYKHPLSLKTVIKRFSKAHVDMITKDNGAEEYCMKEESRVAGPFTFARDDLLPKGKLTLRQQLSLSAQEALDYYTTPSSILMWKKLKLDPMFNANPYNHETTRGVWIYGPPGTGKTHWAREQDPSYYPKLANKWWDGYDGQSTIILEDLGIQVGRMLKDHLKLWLDKWYFTAEVKGTAVQPKYTQFIVTSNYSPDEIFTEPESHHDLQAIKRRLTIYVKENLHFPPRKLK